jgi:hypothetical protein
MGFVLFVLGIWTSSTVIKKDQQKLEEQEKKEKLIYHKAYEEIL